MNVLTQAALADEHGVEAADPEAAVAADADSCGVGGRQLWPEVSP